MTKSALGRGLGALLGGAAPAGRAPASVPSAVPAAAPVNGESVRKVPLERIRACSFQPRKQFSEESLRELADSIKEQGIVQPLLVREVGGNFELIAGERRWRASQILGLAEVPVIVRQADDRAVLELALIENLQREDLNAIEEAQGYADLIGRFQLKQEDVATKVGKSRAVVANALRLLRLAAPLQNSIREGRLSVGHAKVILSLPDEGQQNRAAQKVMQEGWNVRQTEQFVASLLSPKAAPKNPAAPVVTDANVAAVESQIREKLGTRVRLKYSGGKGKVEIAFFSDAELERFLQVIGVKVD